ncbi:MAG: hypothetical protein ACRD9R_12545 [Pyrinomonadaceae bacterium]
MKKLLLAVLMVFVCAASGLADTIYLRDGRAVRGTVLGFINGRFAVRVISTTGTSTTASGTTSTDARPSPEEGEVRFFRPAEIDRIEIDGRSLDEARFETKTLDVALAANWIDSGIELRRGERVQVKATGTIVAGRARITPGGLRSTDPTAPLPRAAEGVLIGAIGNDAEARIVEIGLGREFMADRDGRLYLTANRGNFTDARGAFSVQVRAERDLNFRRRDTAANRQRNENDEDVSADEDERSTRPAPPRSRRPGGRRTDDPFELPEQDRDQPDRDRQPQQRQPRETTVTVPANAQNGVDTGLDLRAGEQVTLDASGTIVAGQRAGSVTPEGGRAGLGLNYPFPSRGPGALLGYVRPAGGGGQAQLFFVGSQLLFEAPVDGRLFLVVNDDRYSDNSGNFTVKVKY